MHACCTALVPYTTLLSIYLLRGDTWPTIALPSSPLQGHACVVLFATWLPSPPFCMWPDPIRGFVRPAVVARIAPSAHVHTQAIFVVINEATMDMTKKLTKALIEMYWERKCLWQVSSEEYKKRDLKKKAYQEIVTFLRRNGVTNANMKQVRDKIQNLRRAMRKEKKRIDDSGGTYSPSLW